jgi:hypothetical protein
MMNRGEDEPNYKVGKWRWRCVLDWRRLRRLRRLTISRRAIQRLECFKPSYKLFPSRFVPFVVVCSLYP